MTLKTIRKDAKKRFKTLEKDCIKKHDGKYTYDNFVYKSMNVKGFVTCPTHGDFSQSMTSHLNSGSGCPKCGRITVIKKVEITVEDFIVKLTVKHPHLDLIKISYTGYKNKALFICKIHNDKLWITPTSILRLVRGCKKCSEISKGLKHRLSNEEFKKKVNNVHNGNIVPLEPYKRGKHKTEFRCERHNEVFKKRASDVINGRGCNICGGLKKYRQYLNEPTILYYIHLHEHNIYKIGITIERVGIVKRFHGYGAFSVIDKKIFSTGKEAFEKEQEIIKKYKKYSYVGEKLIVAGNKELFTTNILPNGLK